jgi:hypothetical protein
MLEGSSHMSSGSALWRCFTKDEWANQTLIDSFGKGVVSTWASGEYSRFYHYFTSFGADVKEDTVIKQSEAYGKKVKENERYKGAVNITGITAVSLNNTHWVLVVVVSALCKIPPRLS